MVRRETSRTRRVGELIQRELAGLMQRELSDVRASKATIVAVDVAPDFSHAKVFVTHLDGAAQARDIVKYLNKASGFLRHALAGRVELRIVPTLRFVYDESVERGIALSQLIERARAEDERKK